MVKGTDLSILFLSTLSLRRATFGQQKQHGVFGISIHALLAESDLAVPHLGKRDVRFLSTLSLRRATTLPSTPDICAGHFYPRSPCGERRLHKYIPKIHPIFLSTLSLRRATSRGSVSMPRYLNFYPRSPCGERLEVMEIGVRAPIFLSTLSLRRATM